MKLFLLLISINFLISCSKESGSDEIEDVVSHFQKDLDEIKADGKLIAITGYNAYSYFIYKGQPMGYEYELLNRLAEHLNLKLEIKIVHDIDEMLNALNNGDGDLIAYNLTVTKSRKKLVSFAHHHTTTRQVLVQSKPKNWRKMKLHEIDTQLLHSPIDLIGKEIHVIRGSAYVERLNNLSNEIGEELNIIEAPPGTSSEDLVEMVANGDIGYTVDDENIAELEHFQYPILDVRMAVSLEQRIAWAVRKNSPQLLNAINNWLVEMKKEVDYYVIYKKYFENRNSYRKRINSDFFSNAGGGISLYDDIIKEETKTLGWDWRLLASLIYQESQFSSDKTSWAGAKGLMQLMPATAKQFGVTKITNPENNLKGGVKYLKWLTDYWREDIPDSTERIKFVMASYNIGPGHIRDARRLAKKYNSNPNIWFNNVDKYLLKKSNPKYYNDDVVKFGYARGTETIKYVNDILGRYDQYLRFIEK